MKKNLLKLAMAVFLALTFSGCATEGPKWVDPGVYRASRDRIITQQEARATANEAQITDQQLAEKRAVERHYQQVAAIRNGSASASMVSTGGVTGGLPVNLNNRYHWNKTVILQKLDGVGAGKTWRIDLPAKSQKDYLLEVGQYQVKWFNDGDSRRYYTYQKKPVILIVTSEPKFFDANGRSYHGGVDLF